MTAIVSDWRPHWRGTTCTCATGIPGGKAAASKLLVYIISPLCSGVCGATRSAVMGESGPWPSTVAVYAASAEGDAHLGLPVVDQPHHSGVVKRLDHLPHQPARPDDRHADVDPVGSPLVDGDGHGEVRAAHLLRLRHDGGQRVEERQVLQAIRLAGSWFFSKARLGLCSGAGCRWSTAASGSPTAASRSAPRRRRNRRSG